MSSVQQTADIRYIPLGELHFAETPAQVARRDHYDAVKLNELAQSFKSEGQLQPIVVRPIVWNNVPRFEIVAGERRARAMKIAGLDEIVAMVRELDDHQAAKVRLIENLQREEEHPLAEAEGYDELVKQHGYTVEQIADETGKSKAYVYARLKLLALGPDGRKSFYDGNLSASTALLIARIPIESLQKKATIEITTHGAGREPMSYRVAVEHVQREYMLRLADASFPTGEDQLCKNIGPCGPCPKRTGNQPELFADVSTKDTCTDPTCFKAKVAAWSQRLIEKAKANGQSVITGKAAKQAISWGENLQYAYVKPTDVCIEDPKRRTFQQLLSKNEVLQPDLLQLESGKVIEVLPRERALKVLREDGVIKAQPRAATRTPTSSRAAHQKADRGREIEEEVELRVLNAIREKDGGKLTPEILRYMCAHVISEGVYGDDLVEKTLGFIPKAIYDQNLKPLEKLSEAKIVRALIDHVYVMEIEFQGTSPSNLVRRMAKRLKIDEKKIRAEVAASLKPPAPPAPAKASKKKATRK